nr:MAG TPA: hypothetical protein [Caudoviricetes sp.]
MHQHIYQDRCLCNKAEFCFFRSFDHGGERCNSICRIFLLKNIEICKNGVFLRIILI